MHDKVALTGITRGITDSTAQHGSARLQARSERQRLRPASYPAAQRCSAVTSFEQPLGQVLWHHESLLVPACQPWSTEADHCCSLLVSAPSPPAPVIDQIASPLEAQTEAQKEQKEALPSTSSRLSLHTGSSSTSSHGIGVNVGNRQVAMRHIGSHELVKLAGARLQHG